MADDFREPPGGRRPPRRERVSTRARGPRAGRAWFQLVFLVVALVVLVLFMTQIGERSAGCFHNLTTTPAEDTPAAREDTVGGGATSPARTPPADDATAHPGPPRIRVQGSAGGDPSGKP